MKLFLTILAAAALVACGVAIEGRIELTDGSPRPSPCPQGVAP